MNSKVIQIPDLKGYQPDPELTELLVTEEEVQAGILSLAKEHGEMVELQETEADCGVVCRNEEGSSILLFPSMGLPGAGQAEKDAAGRKPGDRFTTVLAGKQMTLTVERILLHRSCPIDDSLAVKCGMKNPESQAEVRNLAELEAAIGAELMAKKREEAIRMLVMELQQYLCDHALLELDEAEAEAWTMEQAEISYEENLAFGIDLCFTDDGEMLTKEETLQRLAEEMRQPFISMLVNRKFCEDLGITTDKEGIEAENELYPHVYEELKKAAEEMIV